MAQMRCWGTLEQGTLPFVCLDGRKFKRSYFCYHHIPLELAIATASPSLEERFSIFKACK